MLRLILFICLFFTFSFSYAQEGSDWKSFPTTDTNKAGEGILSDTIKIQTTSKVDTTDGHFEYQVSTDIQDLNEIYIEKSKNNPQIKGYTILLYSGSGANSKLKARNILLQFNEEFPECTAHLAWKSPNYEVRVGDYRTKLEAEKILQDVKVEFPTAFVKKSMIELPALRKQEEIEDQ